MTSFLLFLNSLQGFYRLTLGRSSFFFTAVFLMLLNNPYADAAERSLAWDHPTPQNVDGYKVYKILPNTAKEEIARVAFNKVCYYPSGSASCTDDGSFDNCGCKTKTDIEGSYNNQRCPLSGLEIPLGQSFSIEVTAYNGSGESVSSEPITVPNLLETPEVSTRVSIDMETLKLELKHPRLTEFDSYEFHDLNNASIIAELDKHDEFTVCYDDCDSENPDKNLILKKCGGNYRIAVKAYNKDLRVKSGFSSSRSIFIPCKGEGALKTYIAGARMNRLTSQQADNPTNKDSCEGDVAQWCSLMETEAAWKMKLSENDVAIIVAETTKGPRIIYYGPEFFNRPSSENCIYVSLGSSADYGRTQIFLRSPQADLNKCQPDVSILKVKFGFILENATLDDINNCPGGASTGPGDSDGDGTNDPFDNCPYNPNSNQTDSDSDGIGDACDFCEDGDNDGYCSEVDDCDDTDEQINPAVAEVCDGIDNNCVAGIDEGCNPSTSTTTISIPGTTTTSSIAASDTDGDGIPDEADNCPDVANPGQADSNGNGIGDICDPDICDSSTAGIIDNGCPGTSSTGAWGFSEAPDPFGYSSLYSYGSGVAAYKFEAAANGPYEVFMWWTEFDGRCTDVPVKIYDGDTLLDTVYVNQLTTSGRWDFLGKYDFSGTAAVIIISEGGECHTCADAVRFNPYNPQPNTTSTTTAISSGSGSSGGGYDSSPTGPECWDDTDCEDGTFCYIVRGFCVECLEDAHCDDGLFCNGLEICYNYYKFCNHGRDPCFEEEICEEESEVCIPPAPPPECLTDRDCDNGIFCDGEENCLNGICADGKGPCDNNQECLEEPGECRAIQRISATSLNTNIRKPRNREKQCQRLILKCAKETHFNNQKSMIILEGPAENFSGVEVNTAKRALQIGNFILVPLCVWEDATVGRWTLKIKTQEDRADNPINEIIETSFQIQ